MIEKRMQDEINKQINEELFSAYLYQSMASYFEDTNLKGFAHWMSKQAAEEQEHAKKFYHYLLERGGRVILEAIAKPQSEWSSALAAFEDAYKHELHVTARINEMAEVAEELKDRATRQMLDWFLKEQVEEEMSVDEIIKSLNMLGTDNKSLFILDRELGKR